MSRWSGFKKAEAQAVLIRLARSEDADIRLLFKVFDHVLPRGQAQPGLDADEGGLRLRRVPEGYIAHIRVRDFNGVGVELGFERHALRRGAQYDGVSVEEVVAERYGVVSSA